MMWRYYFNLTECNTFEGKRSTMHVVAVIAVWCFLASVDATTVCIVLSVATVVFALANINTVAALAPVNDIITIHQSALT